MNYYEQNNYNSFATRDISITNVVIPLHNLTEKLILDQINTHHSNSVDYFWGFNKMSRLIESILLRIPLPIFYFDVSNPFSWNSIDGIQRLDTINEFIVNNNFVLQNMEVLTDINGLYYSQLPDNYKRILYDTQIITYQIEAQTPRELREFIFKRIRDMNAN